MIIWVFSICFDTSTNLILCLLFILIGKKKQEAQLYFPSTGTIVWTWQKLQYQLNFFDILKRLSIRISQNWIWKKNHLLCNLKSTEREPDGRNCENSAGGNAFRKKKKVFQKVVPSAPTCCPLSQKNNKTPETQLMYASLEKAVVTVIDGKNLAVTSWGKRFRFSGKLFFLKFGWFVWWKKCYLKHALFGRILSQFLEILSDFESTLFWRKMCLHIKKFQSHFFGYSVFLGNQDGRKRRKVQTILFNPIENCPIESYMEKFQKNSLKKRQVENREMSKYFFFL